MSNVTDAILIIETILGRTVPAAQLQRVANAYVQADPYKLIGNQVIFADPNNPTNEEKALVFIKTLKAQARDLLGQVSDINSDASATATKLANRNTAQADME